MTTSDSSSRSGKTGPEVIHRHKMKVFSSKLVDEKLDGAANYQLWRRTALVTLRAMGLASRLTDDPPSADAPDLARWTQDDNRIFGQLLNSMDKSVKLLVVNCKTSREL
jgi:hypothetical protein